MAYGHRQQCGDWLGVVEVEEGIWGINGNVKKQKTQHNKIK